MADNVPQLGRLCPGDAKRDAVHVAVAPVVAGEVLRPGEHVGLLPDGRAGNGNNLGVECIGIVDPFLRAKLVEEGETFWLCLYQNTVTSLRHVWAHPSFKAKLPVVADDSPSSLPASALSASDRTADSRRWLENFADREGMTYRELMGAVPSWWLSGGYAHGERVGGVEGFDIPPEFWGHYEAVTGATPACRGAVAFSCSC